MSSELPEHHKPMRERIKTFRFYRERFVELVVAGLAVFLITSWIDWREEVAKEAVLPEEWFEVYEVFIPDHPVGSNPGIIYDRAIHEDFRGFWVAEVQRRDRSTVGMNFSACTGSGTAEYEKTDVIPEGTVTWTWFFGRPCTVPPGVYRVVVTYDMRVPDYPVKRYRVVSNTFTVYDPAALQELQRQLPTMNEVPVPPSLAVPDQLPIDLPD